MITGLTFQTALARIGEPLGHWVDEVVPGSVAAHKSASYAPAYAWMFTYEKILRRKIETILGRRLGTLERRLFGPDGALSEGLSNAFLHGHRRSPELPIEVECAVGSRGLLFAIRDRGPGFDVAAALSRLRRGGNYFHVAGNGLKVLAALTDLEAGFADGGRTLLLLVPLDADGNAPSAPVSPTPT